ncbi:hypothetical protein ACOI1C_20855 [Bacillus sp. DJP31]|uniref:hypothetical protein n=1 Tax=Bacillus sp. DJP31 TaxID=3409789 RepID=UPI003BB79D8F
MTTLIRNQGHFEERPNEAINTSVMAIWIQSHFGKELSYKNKKLNRNDVILEN